MSNFAQIALVASLASNALAAPSPFSGDKLSGKFGKDFEQKFNEFFNTFQNGNSVQESSDSSDEAVADGAQAVYFITNDAGNSVVALPIGDDGTLSFGSSTATGGAGSNAVDAATGDAIVPDALVSQSTLTIAGNVSHNMCQSIINPLRISYNLDKYQYRT